MRLGSNLLHRYRLELQLLCFIGLLLPGGVSAQALQLGTVRLLVLQIRDLVQPLQDRRKHRRLLPHKPLQHLKPLGIPSVRDQLQRLLVTRPGIPGILKPQRHFPSQRARLRRPACSMFHDGHGHKVLRQRRIPSERRQLILRPSHQCLPALHLQPQPQFLQPQC